MTAMPHPQVITIQPEASAFDLASTTAATTPSPSRISNAVPMISANDAHTASVFPPKTEAAGRR